MKMCCEARRIIDSQTAGGSRRLGLVPVNGRVALRRLCEDAFFIKMAAIPLH